MIRYGVGYRCCIEAMQLCGCSSVRVVNCAGLVSVIKWISLHRDFVTTTTRTSGQEYELMRYRHRLALVGIRPVIANYRNRNLGPRIRIVFVVPTVQIGVTFQINGVQVYEYPIVNTLRRTQWGVPVGI